MPLGESPGRNLTHAHLWAIATLHGTGPFGVRTDVRRTGFVTLQVSVLPVYPIDVSSLDCKE